MRSRSIFFLLALLTWLILTWPFSWPELIAGILVAGGISLLIGDLLLGRVHLLSHPSRYLLFLFVYLPRLIWEVFKANFDVAYRVLNPRLPIRPGIVAVRTSLVSDVGLTFLANSITLTPGTMTVDVDREKGLLYIHWIDVEGQDAAEIRERTIGRFEGVLIRIFEEEEGSR